MPEDTYDLPSYPDHPDRWCPKIPCRSELECVIQFITDSLTAQEVLHLILQDSENPDLFVVRAYDGECMNGGLVGWDEEKQAVSYHVADKARFHRDVDEGIAEDESKCWYTVHTAEQFVWAMNGDVREVMESIRAKQVAQLDAELAAGGAEDVEGLDIGDAPPVGNEDVDEAA